MIECPVFLGMILRMAVDLEKLFHRDPVSDRGISAVLPMRDVAASVETVLAALAEQLDRIGRGYEIILINDGSTDGTAAAVARLLQSNKRMRAIEHERAEGYGASLRSGLRLAKYPLILEFTADNRYDAAQLDRFLAAIDRVDIVWGRGEAAIGGASFRDWAYRRLVRWVYGVRVRDVGCRFRLFRRAAVRRIPIQSQGVFAGAELIAKATFMNMLVAEVPVTVRSGAACRATEPASESDAWRREAMAVFRRPQFCQPSPDREPTAEF